MEDFNSKYTGQQVEDLLDQVASGNAGGGGGITEETDPIFSASPAASITEEKMAEWDKGATAVQPANLADYVSKDDVDAELSETSANPIQNQAVMNTLLTLEEVLGGLLDQKQPVISDLQAIREGAAKGATAVQPETLSEYALEGYVDNEVKALGDSLAKVATSGSYNDLIDKPTFKTINGESIVGDGNIEISGGSGEVGPQGPQGDKGDKGDKGDTGATGVGVQSVKQTTISNTDGGSNVVTVTLTNGTTSTFTVKNGSKGSNGSNGTNGKDGADGATFTPSVDSAGNLSWTNNKGLTNPPTVNIKGPKGDAGEGGGSTEGEGVIQWTMRYAPDYTNEDGVISLDPFVVYYAGDLSHGGTILFNYPPSNAYNEWRIIFYKASDVSLNVEVELWVNGITPDISKYGLYELSVVDNDGILLGVMAHYPVG